MQLVDLQELIEIELPTVEALNERRGGWSSVSLLQSGGSRLFLKRQSKHYYREPTRLFTRMPTLYREFRNLRKLKSIGVPASNALVFAQQGSEAFMITEAASGTSLDVFLCQDPPVSTRTEMVRRLAAVLFNLHNHHWRHGCLYGKHVFIDPEDTALGVTLIDLEKASYAPRKQSAAAKDLSQLFRNTPGLVDEDQKIILETYQSHWPGFGEKFAERAGRDEGKALSRVEKKRKKAQALQQQGNESASAVNQD